MGRKQVSYSFMSIAFLGNKSNLDSFQAFISQRGCLTIYIQTFRDLQKYLLWEVLLICQRSLMISHLRYGYSS